MKVEIVSTGTELLLGEILNTNFKFLSEKLNLLGFSVLYETTVGDNWQRMHEVLAHAKERTDIVITIGGLGPTQGDITKEVTAEVMDSKLVLDENTRENIYSFFASRNLPMVQANLKQAYVPEESIVLDNERGTAPGIWLKKNGKLFINLPGPPHELKHMFTSQVVPMLTAEYGHQGVIHSRNLRSIGMGESVIAEKLKDIITEQSNPTIAIYASNGEIRIRLTAKADSVAQAETLINSMEQQVRQRVKSIYAVDEQSLPVLLGKMLRKNKLTISFAESCTGGLASSLVTDIAGSSAYLMGSVVTYSNEAKTGIIKVDAQDINTYGAVSEPVARQMAEGVAKLFYSDIGVSITGIAGPDGGSAEKPVGTVYIGVSFNGHTDVRRHNFSGDRMQIKLRTAKMAIFQVLEIIQKYAG